LDVKFLEINKANEDIKEYGDIETEFGKAIDKHEWYVDRYNNYLKNVDKCCSIDENIASNHKFLDKLNIELGEIDEKEKQLLGYSEYLTERDIKNGELADIEKKDEIYRDLNSRVETIDNEFKHFNDKQNEINDKIKDKFALILQRGELEKSVGEIGLYKDRDENLSKLASYIERRDAVDNEMLNRCDKIAQLNANVESIKILIGNEEVLKSKQDEYKNAIVAITKRNDEIEYNIKGWGEKLKETKEFLNELENHGADSKCPFCAKVLGEAYELLLNDSQSKQSKFIYNIESCETELEINLEQVGSLIESHAVVTKKLESINDEKIRCEGYIKSIKEYEDEITQFKNTRKSILAKIDLLSEGDEYDKVEHKRVKTKLSELYDIKTKFDGIRATIKKYDDENLDNKLKEIENKIVMFELERNDYISQLNSLDYDVEIKSIIKERLVFLNEKHEESLKLKLEISKKPDILKSIDDFNATITLLILDRDGYNDKITDAKKHGYTKEAVDDLKALCDELNIKHDKYKDLKRIINGYDDLYTQKLRLEEIQTEQVIKRKNKCDALYGINQDIEKFENEEYYKTKIDDDKQIKEEFANKLSQELTLKSLNTKELSTVIDKIDEMKRYENDIKLLNIKLSLIKQTRRYINLYITHILKTIRHNIEDDASYMINEITDGKYSNIKLDESFDIFLEDCGEYYNIDRFSGGEKDNVALSLRIALSHYLMQIANSNDSTFLIFDEIFGSQDEIRRNNLLKSLKVQENYFPQIFVITHMDNLDDGFTNKLQVEDDNGISRTKYL